MQGLSYRAHGVFQFLLMFPIGILISICTGLVLEKHYLLLETLAIFEAIQLSNNLLLVFQIL